VRYGKLASADPHLTDLRVEAASLEEAVVSFTSDTASQLHLAEGTIRNYLSSAIAKLGVRNRAEAATIARERGWL
jgi:hypothetical protein